MTIISDTTAITNLFKIGEIKLLQDLFDEIVIPKGVYDELAKLEDQIKYIDNCKWIKVEIVEEKYFLELLLNLDRGEAESIGLARKKDADLLIIDELKGRKIAKELGLRIIGLLGVLVIAKKKGHIPNVKSYLDLLVNVANFRVNPKLRDQLLSELGEL